MTILNACTCRSYSFILQKYESQIIHCNAKEKKTILNELTIIQIRRFIQSFFC